MGGLKPGIVAVQIAAIVAILVAVFFEITADYRRVMDDAREEADRVRDVVWESSAQTFSMLETVLGELAADLAESSGSDAGRASTDLSYLDHQLLVSRRGLPFVGTLLATDARGRVIAASDDTLPPFSDLSGDPLFLAHQSGTTSGLFVQEPGTGSSRVQHAQWVLRASRAAFDAQGQFAGIVAASLSLEALADAFGRLRSHYDDVAGLARNDGRLLVRSPFQVDVQEGSLLDAASMGVGVTSGIQGRYRSSAGVYQVDRLISFQKVKHFPVVAYAGVSIDHRLQAWQHRAWVQGGLAVLAVLLVLAFGHMWRRLLQTRERENARRLARMNDLVQASSRLVACTTVDQCLHTLADLTRGLIPCLQVAVKVVPQHFGNEPFDAVSRAGKAGRPGGVDNPCVSATLSDAAGDQLGQMTLTGLPGQRFDNDDHTLLQELAQVASIALQKVWAEQRSRADRDQLETVLDSMSDAVFMLDTEWRFTFLNDYARRLLGDTHGTLIGADIWQRFPELKGTELGQQLGQAVAERCDIDLEFFYERFDAWFHFRAFPSRAGLTVYFQDITEHRNREEHLRQAHKLEAMGQLTGGVAHDFNNLLTVILGNAELLAEMLSDSPKLAQLAHATAHAAVRGSELTAHLLAFARRQPLNPRPSDLGAIVSSMHPMLTRTLGEQVSISLALQPDVWPVMVDSSLFEGVILNLVLNARDAMPTGGQLSIRMVNISLQPLDTNAFDEITPGDYVSITVSDSGVGMSREALARVFDPFFTTKEVGKGSGLGLSMVHGFVKQSGGAIRIYSRPAEGTTVQIYLPRSEQQVERADPAGSNELAHGGTEAVLVVEDEDLVRDFVAAQVRALGYSVTTAANGPQALEVLKGSSAFDLLFTDIMMPGGINGRELADRARMLRPGLKVVFTSGYSDDVIMRDGRLEPDTHLLKKPYRKLELASTLRKALGKESSSS